MGACRFRFEKLCLAKGARRIAGADEAGRGPLAGPVVAAAVILPATWIEDGLPRRYHGINDSKQLTANERDRFFLKLTADPQVCYAVSIVDSNTIDAINILQASFRAINHALSQLDPAPDHTLVDGPHITALHHAQTPIIEGDAKSYSIAAASILAKVTRDRLMLEYHTEFPAYGFAEHKGYGTPQHLAALAEFGPCPIHRRSFAPVRKPQPDLFATVSPPARPANPAQAL